MGVTRRAALFGSAILLAAMAAHLALNTLAG
jgi:hypothetical protein